MTKRIDLAQASLDIVSGIPEGSPHGFDHGENDSFVDSGTAADLEHSEVIESTIPKERVVWWKVYKLVPTAGGTSKRVFKQEILDVSQIKDAELHVRDLAIDKGPGILRLCYYETFANEPRHQSLVLFHRGKGRPFFSFSSGFAKGFLKLPPI